MIPQIALCKILAQTINSMAILIRGSGDDDKKCCIAIDFHNFGHTILGLKLGFGHPIVRILKVMEMYLSRLCCDEGFTVTERMREVLV